MDHQSHPRPKKIDPITAALLDAAEDAEAGVEASGSGQHSTVLRDWKNTHRRAASIPTFDNPDVKHKG